MLRCVHVCVCVCLYMGVYISEIYISINIYNRYMLILIIFIIYHEPIK